MTAFLDGLDILANNLRHGALTEVSDDTVFVTRHSAWTGANVGGLLALLKEVRAAHGSVFVVDELSAGHAVSSDARKRIA